MVREERNLDWAHCDLSLAAQLPPPSSCTGLMAAIWDPIIGAWADQPADSFPKRLEYLCTPATVLKRKLSTKNLVTVRTSLCSTLQPHGGLV